MSVHLSVCLSVLSVAGHISETNGDSNVLNVLFDVYCLLDEAWTKLVNSYDMLVV